MTGVCLSIKACGTRSWSWLANNSRGWHVSRYRERRRDGVRTLQHRGARRRERDLLSARTRLQEALDIVRELQIPAAILTIGGNLA